MKPPAPPHLETFRLPETELEVGEYWIAAVRRRQVTFGAVTVLPLTPYPTFADIPAGAAVELVGLIARIEAALGRLGAERINVVAAMMQQRFVHFHVFGRHSAPVDRVGRTWIDDDWPRPIVLRDDEVDDDTLGRIRVLLRAELAAT